MSNVTTTAEAIQNSARALLIRGGYNSFSYADISEVVGIRKASIHHHFPSKADLVRVVVARYREEAQEGLATLARNISDPTAQLCAYTDYWEACIKDASHPFCVCALLATEIPVLPEEVTIEVRAHFRGLSAWLTSVLERGVEAGRFVLFASAGETAEMLMATVHGAMLSARAYGDASIFRSIVHPLLQRISV